MKKNKFIAALSEKNSAKIFLSVLFLYFFSLNIYQMHDQHWTAMLDQDIKIIYNSLLISSGFEQEYRDHPAYTTFMILGSLFKICSIFFDNFTINETLGAISIDKEFQKLFYIARIVNSFYVFLIVFFIYKILIELKISQSLSILATSLALFFLPFYELLFLLRSEIVSVLMFLVSFYFLLKFLNNYKIFYMILTGFFFCLAMLAKIQVIFLYLSLMVAIPFLIKHLNSSVKFNKLIKTNDLLGLSKIVLFSSFFLYILTQVTLSKFFLKELNDPAFSLLHNEDLFLLLFFIIIYSIFIKLLSTYYSINANQIIVSLGMIISGFVLGLLFVLLLDIIKIIPFHDLNLLRLTNPIKLMTNQTFEMRHEVSILITIKALFQSILGYYDLTAQFNENYNPKILNIDLKIFFRGLHLGLLILLILFYSYKIKEKNSKYLSIVLLFGLLIYNLIFILRETFGYNIFLFPFYIIIISILLNKLNKKYFYYILPISLSIFMLENFHLSGTFKNMFYREPSVYNLCEVEKWKNSENYIKNYNNQSYIKQVDDAEVWIRFYTKRFYLKANDYCVQLRDEEGNRQTNFKID